MTDHLCSLDADLLRRARSGDEAAWHEMVDRYGAYLYRLAFSLLGNGADAEDALQETFAGALRHLRDFEERSSVKTWLSRILVRQAARSHRSRGRHGWVPLDQGSEAVENRSDTRMDVLAGLDSLSPDHREVIVLRELQGMSYEEIADILAVPRGTVESRLFRARQILRERLKDYGA
jgi:RNA polymerase sigma-70 factor (ECF subfamily)